jgi:hypothetical protein
MALEQWVSGAYVGTYKAPGGSAQPIGLTNEGYELQFTPQGESIESSDIYGGALLDGVTRGHNASLKFTMKSFQRALTAGIIWQFTSNPLLLQSATYPAGRIMSSLAGEVVLTGQANTPAAAVDATPYSNNVFGANRVLTASLCILAPGSSINFLLDTRLRQLTLGLVLLPYAVSSNVVFGVTS